MKSTLDLTASSETSIQSHLEFVRLQNLLAALDLHLRYAGAGSAAFADLEAAQQIVQKTLCTLLLHDKSEEAPKTAPEDHARPSGNGFGHAKLTRRDSREATPMAVHALGTLRTAANAYTQWDRERGIVYGLGKVLTEYVGITREKVFGPSEK